MRVLWVVPRFGEAVVGGAETLVRELATRALPNGWTSEVATTCAVDHETWENAVSPGTRTRPASRCTASQSATETRRVTSSFTR